MKSVRTLWISDVHLGSRSCQAESLLRFLDYVECDNLYLVGDIVDVIALKRSVYWPNSHTQVLRRLVEISRTETRVTYVPGNHDDTFRAFVGSMFDSIKIRRRLTHRTADGKRLLVVHGDEMDAQLRVGAWFTHIGDITYCILMSANRNLNRLRAFFGKPYWSLAYKIKSRVGKAMEYVRLFEQGMVDYARRANVDGVVCGHVHQAGLKEIDGRLYCNDGDWVESCTGLVEHHDGTLELLHWTEIEARLLAEKCTPLRTRAA